MEDSLTHSRPSQGLSYHTQNDEDVRSFYNSVRNSNRSRSRMLQLRDYNNFIKWLMIFEYSKPYQIVLDMACGKGGDLEKWRRAGIDGLIGVDIADISIENAKERYSSLVTKSYWVDFVVGNCFGESFETLLHANALPVDTVSCQFALHYAFDSKERLATTLFNICMALKPGGKFFGTVPSSYYLEQKLAQGEIHWGNNIFNIRFEEETAKRFRANDNKFKELTGNKYTFYLSEAVNDVPEYVVPFDMFAKEAEKYGLKLLHKASFMEYFRQQVSGNERVLNEAVIKKLTGHNGVPTFDPDQLEVCSIYLMFVFEKI